MTSHPQDWPSIPCPNPNCDGTISIGRLEWSYEGAVIEHDQEGGAYITGDSNGSDYGPLESSCFVCSDCSQQFEGFELLALASQGGKRRKPCKGKEVEPCPIS
jgi:hypothetical protein